MEDRDIEIEPYEEIVGRAEVYSTPSGSRSASPVSVDRSLPPAQSLSQGPSTSVYNANLMTSVMRPDPRYEIALASQVPHTQTEHPDTSAVAVTLSPERGARMVRLQHEIPDRLDRPVTAPVIVPENPVSNDLVNSRPRSAPLPWMTAITDRVNALWNAIYDRRPVVASALDRELPEVQKGLIPTCDRQETYVSPVVTVRSDPHVSTVPGRKLWAWTLIQK